MKLSLHCRNVRRRLAESCLVAAGLSDLERQMPIDSASVTLERLSRPHPRFRARLQAVVHGPDLSAEGVDYTLDAAILKAIRVLQHQVQARTQKRDHHERDRALMAETVRRKPGRSPSGPAPQPRPLKSHRRECLPFVLR